MIDSLHVKPVLAAGAETVCLWGVAATRYAAHGLDGPTVATLLGGVGTCLFGIVAASREARAWLDRFRPPLAPEPNPHILPLKRG